jgi:uncharacterized protein (TIRG00374 family)
VLYCDTVHTPAVAAAPAPSPFKRLLHSPWLGQVVFALAFIGLAAWQVSWGHIVDAFRHVRPEWVGVALLIYLGTRIVNAWEWQVLLSKVGKPPMHGLLGIMLIGSLVNAVLPGNLGDVAKIQIAANRYALPRAGLIAGRGAEALINNFMFVVVAVIGIMTVRGDTVSRDALWFFVPLTIAATIGVIALSRVLPEALPQWRFLRRLPPGLYSTLEALWPRIHDGFEAIRRPRLLGILVALGLFGWTVDIAINWSYGNAFGLDVSFGAYVSVTLALAIITTFPVTFGNIGTWEVAVVGALALYDVPADEALAYALGSHVFVTLFNVTLGLVAMAAMRLHPGEVFRFRKAPEATGRPEPAAASAS